MSRTILLFSIAALVLPSLLSAAEKPKTIKGWGSVVDPADDCEFTQEDDRVTITVPPTPHDLNPSPRWDNVLAPRVLEDVEGDFVASVKVNIYNRPKANTSSNKINSFVAAGLVVWQDEKNFLRLLRAANGESGRLFIHFEGWVDGKMTGDALYDIADEATYLRASRKGGQFSFDRSKDGKEWFPFAIAPIDMPKELKVGVAAINSTTKAFKPRFEDFVVENQK
jgi:regulation of enolase protein 1 (concanavalin A-like superfamily)